MKYDFLKSNTAQILSMNRAMLQFRSSLATHALVSSNIGKTIINTSAKPLTFSSKNWFESLFPTTSALSARITKQATDGLNIAAIQTPTFPSVSHFHEVQSLIQTINSFHLDESMFPSGAINDINNADIHTDTVEVSKNLANNITAVLKENDILIEDSLSPSQKSKTISISTFKKYLEMIVTLITIAGFIYTVGHDYISDKANAKYQSQMLKEAHQQTLEDKKQTKLLQDIDDKLSIISTSTSTEKQ